MGDVTAYVSERRRGEEACVFVPVGLRWVVLIRPTDGFLHPL